MAIRIPTPNGAAEAMAVRSKYSKTFDLGAGKRRAVVDVGPLHWHDGSTWQDVDVEWEPVAGGKFGVRSTSYRADFDPATFTLRYESRALGDIRIRLVSIGGVAPTVVTPTLSADGERIRFLNIGSGVSIMVDATPSYVEIYRRYAGPTLPAIVWEVSESPTLGTLRTNVLTMSGVDNYDRSSVARESETNPPNVSRFVEVNLVKGAITVVNGRNRYTVTEQLTGRTQWRDPVTRVPAWRTGELVYPVRMDVQVVEDILDTLDDGHTYPSGASENWNGTNSYIAVNANKAPAWRFVSVDISQGATIDLALLRVYVGSTGTASAPMYGEAVDDAAQWAHVSANGPNRMTRTTASITFGSFSATGFTDRDVTVIVQEIVNRAGWVANNDLRLGCTTPSGSQVNLKCLDYQPSLAARLTIDYTAGGAGSVIPVITRQYRSRVA